MDESTVAPRSITSELDVDTDSEGSSVSLTLTLSLELEADNDVPVDRDDGEDLLKLNKNVFIAYTDIAAAGSRALLGIDMRIEYHSLPVPEVDLAGYKPACERARAPGVKEQHFRSLQILNHKYEEFSLIIINTLIPGDKCHYVANKILDLCKNSDVQKVVVLTVLRLDVPDFMLGAIFENSFCGSEKLTSHRSLPGDILVEDPFLNTLLQLVQVDEYPTYVLTIPGFRATAGPANAYDGSQQNIKLFQETINELTGLKFDNDLSNSLLYKEENDPNVNMAKMIYI